MVLLDGVEVIGHGRAIERLVGETPRHVAMRQDETFGTRDQIVEVVMKDVRDQFFSAGNHRDGARGHATRLVRDARSGRGEPATKRAQQCGIDRRHLMHDVVEGGPVQLDHNRIARRDDRRRARDAGKEADLADRLAHPDFVDGARLALDPDLEAAGYHDIDGIGRRALADQNFAAKQRMSFHARADFSELIVGEIAEDRRRTQ